MIQDADDNCLNWSTVRVSFIHLNLSALKFD